VNAVIYLLVAALAAVLGGRATYRSGRDPLRRDFAILCALTAIAYTSFSLYLFPGLVPARYPFIVAGAFLPVATLRFLQHFFAREGAEPGSLVRRMWIATPLVVLTFLAGDLLLYPEPQDSGPPELVLGLLVYSGFGLALIDLWRRHQRTPYRVEKARLRYLFGFMAASVAFSALEGADRVFAVSHADVSQLPLLQRAMELQGHLPPIGALFAGLFLFFLYQVLRAERLLDLNEIFGRMLTTAGTAALFVVIVGLAGVWFRAATANQVQTTFHLFVATVLFLLAYDPVRDRIAGYTARWFNVRGHQLAVALDELDIALPKIIALDDLAHTLLERLHSSGRVPSLSLYVFDPDRHQVRLLGKRSSEDEHRPMPAVAIQPFADGFELGERAYVRQDLSRASRRAIAAEEQEARLRMMDAMYADLVIPMMSGDLVLGWLAVKDEEWSDGFSQEEVARLCRTMSRAAVVVENIKGFEATKEQARLAALGTMSAGLAHEIRNPLAGIKGAAQYLQTLDVTAEEEEFLQVITDETDRLNAVVTSFLAYARHFELDKQPADLDDLIGQVLTLVRAQGLPEGVGLIEDLDGDLPAVPVDGDQLKQVLLNLVQNAIQALPQGGRVHVSTRRGYLGGGRGPAARAVLISIADDGEGIRVEEQEKLFVPFYTTKRGGTGLGLPICQRIVRAHGGELGLESREGAGATFTVRLPVPVLLPPAETSDTAAGGEAPSPSRPPDP
jgi:two-component system sensor histidine kinase HydH